MTQDASALLDWYDAHRRALPWRESGGVRPDPYAVWLSEIMLQQTTVVTVLPYYERFLTRFPTVEALAAAPLDDVLRLWAGLGYYARARNLHACAERVAALGGFPDTVDGLLALPGIGVYTARAIAAIAFGRPVVPVDGNVERVTARVFAVEAPLPAARRLIAGLAETLGDSAVARRRPSDFAQALFDLGATICTPRNPSCLACPWTGSCLGRARGVAADLPRKEAKAARPVRHGVHFVLTDREGKLLLRRRPEKGLLGGMTEFPGPVWRADPWDEAEALRQAPAAAAIPWRRCADVTHVFTHFTLRLAVYAATLPAGRPPMIDPAFGTFRPVSLAALPGVMKKCLAAAKGPVCRS